MIKISSILIKVSFVAILICTSTATTFAAVNNKSIELVRSSNQSLYISDANAGFNLSSDFTFEAWLKLKSAPNPSENYSIFTQWNSSSQGFVFTYTNVSGVLKLRLEAQNAANTSSVEKTINYDLGIGIWRHVAMTYEASTGIVEFFIDGFSIGKLTGFPINLNDSSADVVVGHDGNYGAGSSFNGLIDEIRVWDIARNQGKIQNQQFEVLSASTTNLRAYWRLENNLNDRTNNGKNLSSYGSPAFINEPAHKLLCGLNTMPLYVNLSTFTITCSVLGVS